MGFFVFPKPTRDAQQIRILTNVFWRAPSAEENGSILLGSDVLEGDVSLNGVTFPLLGNGPPGFDFVEHHLVAALFRRCDHRFESRLNDSVKGIERIHCFRGIANNDEDLWLFHKMEDYGWSKLVRVLMSAARRVDRRWLGVNDVTFHAA